MKSNVKPISLCICKVLELNIIYGEWFYLYIFEIWNYIGWISNIYETVSGQLQDNYRTIIVPLQHNSITNYFFKKNKKMLDGFKMSWTIASLTILNYHEQLHFWRFTNVKNNYILDSFKMSWILKFLTVLKCHKSVHPWRF